MFHVEHSQKQDFSRGTLATMPGFPANLVWMHARTLPPALARSWSLGCMFPLCACAGSGERFSLGRFSLAKGPVVCHLGRAGNGSRQVDGDPRDRRRVRCGACRHGRPVGTGCLAGGRHVHHLEREPDQPRPDGAAEGREPALAGVDAVAGGRAEGAGGALRRLPRLRRDHLLHDLCL